MAEPGSPEAGGSTAGPERGAQPSPADGGGPAPAPGAPLAPPPGSAPTGGPARRAPTRGALALLERVRTVERRSFFVAGLCFAASALLLLVPLAGLTAATAPRLGLLFLVLAPLTALALFLGVGVGLSRRKVGDLARTARLLAQSAPGVTLDLLSAVELSRALKERHDFSPDLARAFLEEVDARAARLEPNELVDRRLEGRAALALLACALVALVAVGARGERLRGGLERLVSGAPPAAVVREPITGDFELTYRYPTYTGLEARTVAGGDGAVSGPEGTEVAIVTRADRDVATAVLVVNGARLPLAVSGRSLSGAFVLDAPGQYHVAFLEAGRVVAEGPDLPVQVVKDAPPAVRLLAPEDALELEADALKVGLRFEATDDYGLSSLDLVFRAPGVKEQRIALRPDDGRVTRGAYGWELGALTLLPGQTVSYWLEAKDTDTVKGPKKGTSRTQTVTVYSAAAHRRAALAKAEKLWERLVTHLADRLEGNERALPLPPDTLAAGQATDGQAQALAQDLIAFSAELQKERDPPAEVAQATDNIGSVLQRDSSVIAATRFDVRTVTGPTARGASPRPSGLVHELAQRLVAAVKKDVVHAEGGVLYLEQLLDRERLLALKSLAHELRTDRKELQALLDDYAKTKDESTREALLQQMTDLRQRMMELQRRMSELAKGIRDEHMNEEALKELMQEEDLGSRLDELERLVREGKTDEALLKMQELAMEMDAMLEKLDDAADEADEEADPELARMFDEFEQALDETTKKQEEVGKETKALRDKYRSEAKDRIAQQGAALKSELKKQLAELKKDYAAPEAQRLLPQAEEARQKALQYAQFTEEALDSNDFDLAADSADRLAEKASALEQAAEDQSRNSQLLQQPPMLQREAQALEQRLEKSASAAEQVSQKLKALFPRGDQMSPEDQQKSQALQKQQRSLEKDARALERKAEDLNERAPVMDDSAKQMLQQAGQRMSGASERLGGKDPGRAAAEQQGALEALNGVKQQLGQSGSDGQKGPKGKKPGLPRPLRGRGKRGGHGDTSSEKVEIPDEDPNHAPREFRKDVMDAMKQGAPDKYKDQNKHYYEELVK